MARRSVRPEIQIPPRAGEEQEERVGLSIPEIVLCVVAILLLGALGIGIQGVLSPFVTTLALVFVLYPLRRLPFARRLIWLAVLLFAVWFVDSIIGLLAPFILAFLVAYALNPLVSGLERRSVPRWLSALLSILLLVGIVVAVALFLLPAAFSQFQGIIQGANALATGLVGVIQSGAIFEYLARFGIPVEKAREMITQELLPRVEGVLRSLFEAVFGFVSSISTLVLQIINAVIIPFLAFYLLKDFPLVIERFVFLFPRARRPLITEIGGKVDQLMGKYLRGAVIVAIIQGTIAGMGLWIIGVNYPLVLGIMTGILDFVPYIGLLTSLVVSCVVAVFSGDPVMAKVIAVVVLFLSQKLLEATVLAPKIVGSQVGLHPVLLILCLMVFGYFLGFVGLLIAVPATALIIAAVREVEAYRKLRQST